MLLESESSLTVPVARHNTSNLKKLPKYFNSITVVEFFRIPLFPSSSLFPNTLGLYLKDSKLLLLAISALKLVASSFQ